MKTVILFLFIFMSKSLFAQIPADELAKKKTFTVWLQARAHVKDVYKLDVSNSAIFELSKDIKKMKNLHKLWLENNDLTTLPEELCSLKNLQMLHLQGNDLTKLPQNFGNLKALQELNLTGNPLPESEINRVQQALPNCKIIFKTQ